MIYDSAKRYMADLAGQSTHDDEFRTMRPDSIVDFISTMSPLLNVPIANRLKANIERFEKIAGLACVADFLQELTYTQWLECLTNIIFRGSGKLDNELLYIV